MPSSETTIEDKFDSIRDTIETFSTSAASFLFNSRPWSSRSLVSSPSKLRNLGNGEFIIVMDSTSRENEGDIIIAAEDLTTEKMAFMICYSRFVVLPCHSPTLPDDVTHS